MALSVGQLPLSLPSSSKFSVVRFGMAAGVALFVALLATSTASARDSHFMANVKVIWNQAPNVQWDDGTPNGGAPPGMGDRAIFDQPVAGSTYVGLATRDLAQLVFLPPYTGVGLNSTAPNPAGTGTFAMWGVDGVGVISEVNQEITLSDRFVVMARQEWRIDSATGSIRQLSNMALDKRMLNLNANTLTLNPVQAGNTFYLNNPISGAGALAIKGAGKVYLNAINTYQGGTFLNGGQLVVSSDNQLGAASGALHFDGGELEIAGTGFGITTRPLSFGANGGAFDIVEPAAVVALDQALDGTGPLTKRGPGALALSGVSTLTGPVVIEQGTLALTGAGSLASAASVQADAQFDISAISDATSIRSLSGSGVVTLGARTLALTQAADTFSGSFTGSGALLLLGGSQIFSGDSPGFTGVTTVEGGSLSVNGNLGGAMQVRGGRLQGAGAVGATTIFSGGTIAPGNSIGALTVNGMYIQHPGATYEVELDPATTTSDLIKVNGLAVLLPNAAISVTNVTGAPYVIGQQFRVLTSHGLAGDYIYDELILTPFLHLVASRDLDNAYLTVVQRRPIIDIITPPGLPPGAPPSVTPNEVAVAESIETLARNNPVRTAVVNQLTVVAAQVALDQLSGVIHPSSQTALVEDSWLLRAAINDRLLMVERYDGQARVAPWDAQVRKAGGVALWGQGFGGWGRASRDGNAPGQQHATGGFLLGADMAAFGDQRMGVIAGFSRTNINVSNSPASGQSDNYHVGLYGGGHWGALALRGGASYTWHELDTRRVVLARGLAGAPRARYSGATAQIFGEVGYGMNFGQVVLEPFAGLAYIHMDIGGFTETGAMASLSGKGDRSAIGYSSLGVRASTTVQAWGTDVRLRGGLGWRHAFGDVNPHVILAFDGGGPFSVEGLAIARDALIAEAGMDVALNGAVTVGLAYNGQLAQETQQHVFKGVFAVKF